MIRESLRSWLLRLAFGEDPAALLVSLRAAAAAVRGARAEIRDHAERLQRLERRADVTAEGDDGAGAQTQRSA